MGAHDVPQSVPIRAVPIEQAGNGHLHGVLDEIDSALIEDIEVVGEGSPAADLLELAHLLGRVEQSREGLYVDGGFVAFLLENVLDRRHSNDVKIIIIHTHIGVE